MTTSGEIVEYVRDINVLLELDTYQGMSDAEIQSVIDFWVSNAKSTTEIEVKNSAEMKAEQELLDARTAHAQAAANVLQSMLEVKIPWVKVGGDL